MVFELFLALCGAQVVSDLYTDLELHCHRKQEQCAVTSAGRESKMCCADACSEVLA